MLSWTEEGVVTVNTGLSLTFTGDCLEVLSRFIQFHFPSSSLPLPLRWCTSNVFLLLETGESVWRKDAGRGRCSHRERRWGGVFARFHISQHLQPPCDGVFFIWKITTCEVRESDLFTIMIEPILLDNYHLNILYCKVLSSALPSIKNKTSCSADNITYKANYLMFIGTVLNSVGLIFFKMQYIHTLNITGYLHFKVIYYLQDYCLCNVWLITQLFCYLKKPK